MKLVRLAILIFAIVVIACIPAAAYTIQPGDHVQFKATNPAGVPLHRESKSSMFARLPDGSIVKVLHTTHSNWLQISHGGLTGWIVKRYVAKIIQTSAGSRVTPTKNVNTWGVWRSPGMCKSVVAKGGRLPRAPGTIRLVTWNIRWFPLGTMTGNDHAKYTDQAWLSCALAWLNADIIAVEEVLDYSSARMAMKHVLDGLHDLSGGN